MMNSLFRNVTRSAVRQPVLSAFRPATSTSALLARPFSVSSIAFNTTNPSSSSSTNETSINNETTPAAPKDKLWPLRLAHDLYAVVRVHNNPFLVTEGDIMTLPFHLKTAEVGDTLDFHDIGVIGSRNFTLSHDQISHKTVSVKGVVIEKTKFSMRVTEKTKRRQRRIRHTLSKPHKTLIRVTEIKLL